MGHAGFCPSAVGFYIIGAVQGGLQNKVLRYILLYSKEPNESQILNSRPFAACSVLRESPPGFSCFSSDFLLGSRDLGIKILLGV